MKMLAYFLYVWMLLLVPIAECDVATSVCECMIDLSYFTFVVKYCKKDIHVSYLLFLQ